MHHTVAVCVSLVIGVPVGLGEPVTNHRKRLAKSSEGLVVDYIGLVTTGTEESLAFMRLIGGGCVRDNPVDLRKDNWDACLKCSTRVMTPRGLNEPGSLLADSPPEPSTTSTSLASTTTTLPATFAAKRSTIALGWDAVEVPTLVVALCHRALVGTDEELIFWGGNQSDCEYESPTGNPAMAYNPATGMWRQLSESPMEPVVAPTGVWTGSEVIFCCGMTSRQAAAYDPDTDTWRTLAESPLGGPFPEARWIGEEMVVITQTGTAAYNLATDSWREFLPMPEDLGRTNEIEWAGSEIVVWPRGPVGDPQRRVEQGMALDPTTDTWRVLPDPEPWPSWVDMVVADDSIIIWGGLPAHYVGSERAVGAQYDLEEDTWSPMSEALPEPDGCECNLGSQTLTWTGEYVLVSPGWFSSGVNPDTPVLIAFHPETNSWILVDEESPLAWGGDNLTVGDRLVIVANYVFYTSPPNWQPTGETITQDSWSD